MNPVHGPEVLAAGGDRIRVHGPEVLAAGGELDRVNGSRAGLDAMRWQLVGPVVVVVVVVRVLAAVEPCPAVPAREGRLEDVKKLLNDPKWTVVSDSG